MTDSLAILQTTMIIAVGTIFFFGGSITMVCRKMDVLEKRHDKEMSGADAKLKGLKQQKSKLVDNTHNYLLEFLTWEKTYVVESKPRYSVVMDGEASEVEISASAAPVAEPPSEEPLVSNVPKVLGLDDQLDMMRESMPSASSTELKRMLSQANGDVYKAISMAKAEAASSLKSATAMM